MSCPFQTLGLTPDCTESTVIYACSVLMIAEHPVNADPDPVETERERELIRARDECLEKIRAARAGEDVQG